MVIQKSNSSNNEKPRVLIVGAGLGGLTLAILLEQAGIDYQILERAAEVRPIGSAMTVSFVIMPMMEQLGLLDEIIAAGNPGAQTDRYIIGRPALYNIHVPPHRVLRSKKVTSIDQDRSPDRVTMTCEDGSSYAAQILVGADGAHSVVRKSLYTQLAQRNKLPMSDQEELKFRTTEPLDPKIFPEIEEPLCTVNFVLGEDKPYTWAMFTSQQKTIMYSAQLHPDKSYRVSEKDTYSHSNRNSTSFLSPRNSTILSRSPSILNCNRNCTLLNSTNNSRNSALLNRNSTLLSYTPSTLSRVPSVLKSDFANFNKIDSAASSQMTEASTSGAIESSSISSNSSIESTEGHGSDNNNNNMLKPPIQSHVPIPISIHVQTFAQVKPRSSPRSVATRISLLSVDSKCSSPSLRETDDWGLLAIEMMCDGVRNYAIASGGGKTMTLGDLIDRTPKNQITKVMLEEKLFTTWYSGRVVLLGDGKSCHKMNPAGGEGAMNTMQDGLAIANWLSAFTSSSKKDLERVFKEYRKERYPIAKAGFKNSQQYSRLYGKVGRRKQ
ncbi:hypothetical protein BGZ95_010416 [Linnemannia exigua]|uniref:FAD-binding domain-containing protein n=1 Tax=Linnemannia exigua TaxID=604196 RepID=A0AAD4H754_9FUNG|nr:hypothetical protein BGZ95_010416 [Linnemannia exigua]